MVDVSITPIVMGPGVDTEDIVVGASGSSITTGQTFEILAEGNDQLLVVIKFSGTVTVTFNAGDVPPSPRGIKGADTVAGTNAQAKLWVPEAGRHVQDGVGKIEGSTSGGTVIMSVYRLPPGFVSPLKTYNGILNS